MADFNKSDIIIDMATTVISWTNEMSHVYGIVMIFFIKIWQIWSLL